MPSTTKALLDAIELGVKKANFYDNEIGDIANLTDVVNSTGDELVKTGIVKREINNAKNYPKTVKIIKT